MRVEQIGILNSITHAELILGLFFPFISTPQSLEESNREFGYAGRRTQIQQNLDKIGVSHITFLETHLHNNFQRFGQSLLQACLKEIHFLTLGKITKCFDSSLTT